MIDTAKVLPWLLTTIFAVICWKQQQTINTYEQERLTNVQPERKVPSSSQTQNNSTGSTETKPTKSPPIVKNLPLQHQPAVTQLNTEKPLTKEELEDLIEHRAVERQEELENEKLQKRVEQLSGHMQTQVDEWSENLGWSEDTQNTMMDIMTDYVYGRVEVHVMLKNGTIERDGIRPYFQQIAKERNEAIIELVGPDDFSEIEDSLHPQGGKK